VAARGLAGCGSGEDSERMLTRAGRAVGSAVRAGQATATGEARCASWFRNGLLLILRSVRMLASVGRRESSRLRLFGSEQTGQ
jgi:hypothetical protein